MSKRGRPKVDDARTERVRVYVSAEEKARLEAESEETGTPVSTLVYERLYGMRQPLSRD